MPALRPTLLGIEPGTRATSPIDGLPASLLRRTAGAPRRSENPSARGHAPSNRISATHHARSGEPGAGCRPIATGPWAGALTEWDFAHQTPRGVRPSQQMGSVPGASNAPMRTVDKSRRIPFVEATIREARRNAIAFPAEAARLLTGFRARSASRQAPTVSIVPAPRDSAGFLSPPPTSSRPCGGEIDTLRPRRRLAITS